MAEPARKENPAPAPKEAVDYIKNKGWKVGFDYRDVWREEHAVGFTVAKAMQLDVLESVRTEVERAIEEGVTLRQFQKTLTPRLQELGWWGKNQMLDPVTGQVREVQLGSPRRLRTIYNVNCRTARAAGQWQRIERTKKGLPFLLFQIGSSRKHRPQHLAWNGTLLSVDDPWWDTHMPPMGYGCKCHVRQVGAAEKKDLEEDGIQDPAAPAEIDLVTGLPTGRIERRMMPVNTTAPPIRRRPWLNKRTGATLMVPEGIDPGFDSNPGKTRLANISRVLAGKLEIADVSAAHVAIRDIVSSRDFMAFHDAPIKQLAMPVLRLREEAARAIGAKQSLVSLSGETLEKNKSNHPELTIDDYRTLPDLGESPSLIVQDGENTVVIIRREEKIYRGAIKATQSREGTFIMSFRLTHPDDIRALIRKGKVVYGEWK